MASFRVISRRGVLLSGSLAFARPARPAIVMIHGAGGPDSRRFPCRRYAQDLASAGFEVLLPSYSSKSSKFEDWLHQIDSAIDSVRGSANKHVGLLGFSQGGGLAIVEASRRKDIGAVIVWSGNLPDRYYQTVETLPPTLLLHGAQDTVIPLADAQQVVRLCKLRTLPCELVTLPGQGHGFTDIAERRALDQTIKFFQAHLQV